MKPQGGLLILTYRSHASTIDCCVSGRHQQCDLSLWYGQALDGAVAPAARRSKVSTRAISFIRRYGQAFLGSVIIHIRPESETQATTGCSTNCGSGMSADGEQVRLQTQDRENVDIRRGNLARQERKLSPVVNCYGRSSQPGRGSPQIGFLTNKEKVDGTAKKKSTASEH